MRRLWAICCGAIVVAGCYRPALPEDQPCSETGACPEGLTCDLGSQTCVSGVPAVARFTTISSHLHHACGIDSNGALWCWGGNELGELGLGDINQRLVPARVGTETDWRQISAGGTNTCGIRADDSLWCWGEDLAGRNDHDLLPKQIPGSWSEVSVGDDEYCALAIDHTLSCVARSNAGDLIVQPTTVVPVHLAIDSDAICVLDAQQQMFCWGDNGRAQLGDPVSSTTVPIDMPVHIPGNWQSVVLGNSHACAIDTDGALSCWGECLVGQTGVNSTVQFCRNPKRVGTDTYLAVDAGDEHTCAVRADGVMVCFGQNLVGELGSQGGLSTFKPTEISGFDRWTSVAAGSAFTCGLRVDGEAWCWGTNQHGELGDGGGGLELEPTPVEGTSWASVQINLHTGCALDMDRALWCWGANAFGQVGDGTTFERTRPVEVGTDHDWTAVATGPRTTCGIRAPGTLWCWGDNARGQLGNGSQLAESSPIQVGMAEDWTEVAVVGNNACGIQGGVLFCWGENIKPLPEKQTGFAAPSSLSAHFARGFSALSDRNAFAWSDRPFGTAVETTVMDWTTLDTGFDHLCGLRGDQIWCFGSNYDGQVGCCNDDRMNRTDAIQEQTLGSWTQVSAGDAATCAIATDGHLACWGEPSLIAAGPDAVATDRATTVGAARWRSVSVGDDDACGVQMDGTLACWGFGDSSAHGNGHGGHERPVRVSAP